jgi:hypothetical protein
MNISKRVIILSAELSGNTNESNRQRTTNLEACLQDCNINFGVGHGVYNNGPEETSFVVLPKDEIEAETVRDFAFKSFGQEAILEQDANQEAYLVEANGKTTQLGRLEQVTKEVAHKKGSYTVLNDIYYTAIPRAGKAELL